MQKDKKRSETQAWDPTKFGSQGEVLARTLTSWDESDKERVAILNSIYRSAKEDRARI